MSRTRRISDEDSQLRKIEVDEVEPAWSRKNIEMKRIVEALSVVTSLWRGVKNACYYKVVE
jgi:hypothetical protein